MISLLTINYEVFEIWISFISQNQTSLRKYPSSICSILQIYNDKIVESVESWNIFRKKKNRKIQEKIKDSLIMSLLNLTCIIQFYYTISQTVIKHDFDIQLTSANQVVSAGKITLQIKTPNIF